MGLSPDSCNKSLFIFDLNFGFHCLLSFRVQGVQASTLDQTHHRCGTLSCAQGSVELPIVAAQTIYQTLDLLHPK